MNLYKWLLPLALAAGSALLPACKKDTDETERDYLTGRLSLSLPAYVNPGYTKTFGIDSLMTLTRSDGGTIGYRFVNVASGEADTLVTADGVVLKREYTLTVAEELESRVLTFSAFVPDDAPYYSSSVSATYTVVQPGWEGETSITNFVTDPDGRFTDGRDGTEYYETEAGDGVWMRNNLAWEGAGVAFERCAAMSGVFGRYYTWEEAQTACPEGWHLPTDAEWSQLAPGAEPGTDIPELAGRVMADLYFNGTKMWEYWREVPVRDELRLSVMPAGYATIADGTYSFAGLYAYAAFWTADEAADGQGVYRYIYHDKNIVYRGRASKTDFAASVRCVRAL